MVWNIMALEGQQWWCPKGMTEQLGIMRKITLRDQAEKSGPGSQRQVSELREAPTFQENLWLFAGGGPFSFGIWFTLLWNIPIGLF